MNRAYSLLEIKAVDEEQRIIEGWATTPTPDRVGDVVEPMGARFRLPIPFLFQHGKDAFVGQTPVGNVIRAVPSNTGIRVRVQIEKSDEPGRLKDALDFAWQAIRLKLVRGLSIGFKELVTEPIKGRSGAHSGMGLGPTFWRFDPHEHRSQHPDGEVVRPGPPARRPGRRIPGLLPRGSRSLRGDTMSDQNDQNETRWSIGSRLGAHRGEYDAGALYLPGDTVTAPAWEALPRCGSGRSLWMGGCWSR